MKYESSPSFIIRLSSLRIVGMSSVSSISGDVHGDLSAVADQLSYLVGEYGAACEALLLKYRKNIIRESPPPSPAPHARGDW